MQFIRLWLCISILIGLVINRATGQYFYSALDRDAEDDPDSRELRDVPEEREIRKERLLGMLQEYVDRKSVDLNDEFDERQTLEERSVPRQMGSSSGSCASGVVELSSSTSTIESPGLAQGKYPNRLLCQWRITAPANSVINLKFDRLNLEQWTRCANDYVSVYDGRDRHARMLGQYCGKRLPHIPASSGSTLFVVFQSDNSISTGGFVLSWKFAHRQSVSTTTPSPTPGCSGSPALLQQDDGTFTSPNFGASKSYPNDAKCSWRIIVNPTMNAFLRFDNFTLEPAHLNRPCTDVVAIYDGADTKAAKLGSFCGSETPSDVIAAGNTLFVTFESESLGRYAGFKATFSARKELVQDEGRMVDCGVAEVPPNIYSRIVGGTEAQPNSWPWQISLAFAKGGHFCGGSIIDKRWIATAAHCVYDTGTASDFKVVVGEHNRLVTEGTEKQLGVESVIIHEKYDHKTHDNDIALLRLSEDITFNSNIKPVCIPRQDVADNMECITTGWGETQSTGNHYVLNQVRVPIIAHKECSKPGWYGAQLTENMICAGYPEGRKDSCQGDSGGPLVCLTNERWRLYGVTSWGFGCAEANHPGVYARVTRYLGWLQTKTNVTPARK